MENFVYYAPTQVVFGKGTEQQAGALCGQYGAKKVLLHYGGGSAKNSGLIQRVGQSLADAGLGYVELGGVQPNPRLALVREGIELCKKEGVDFILAVGGGSVIDSAKAIGYGLADEPGGDVWDFYTGTRQPQKNTPIGVVVTIAAAGSEMSNSSVITNEETGEKRGCNSDILGRVKFAVMNPELTVTVPPFHTAAGCADILMHTMERYFTPVKDTMEMTDAIAEALMKNVVRQAQILSRDPEDYNARAEVMWAGALSHNGLTGAGAGGGDWAPHQLSHEISAKYDMSHGASLTTIWGSWARYVYKQDPARFARFAAEVLEMPEEGSLEKQALAGIEEMEGFFWGLELPTSLEEAGHTPTEEDIKALARGASRGGTRTLGGFMVLGEADMEAIYKMALTNE